MAAPIEIKSVEQFESILQNEKGLIVVYFWASWAEPCKQMSEVFTTLAKQYTYVKFLTVEAEVVTDITERYEVISVPFFAFIKNGKGIDKLEGANAPELNKKLQKHALQTAPITAAAAAVLPAAPAAAAAAASGGDLRARLERLVNYAPVMLFMKGTPDAPRCGFSRQMVELLRSVGAKFSSFDILTDESVRQGLKEYSNWPTYPQLYVKGKLIGGLDIARELHENGELAKVLDVHDEQRARLEQLINSAPVMLFMKGTPEAPRCGFSRQMVELLKTTGVPFSSFDILTDESVRQGLKEYSNWPTYPQLYVKGKLIGGLDIARELHEQGELQQTLSGVQSANQ